ncbi:hypothetical protein ACFQ88_11600 [Paenibacillus sp. NPDC056579]|uniref:hypothetical protein n=1 Tax=Paenibacillus sp. NPDC056579 TaxID=3345871 RepID=UPI00367F820C
MLLQNKPGSVKLIKKFCTVHACITVDLQNADNRTQVQLNVSLYGGVSDFFPCLELSCNPPFEKGIPYERPLSVNSASNRLFFMMIIGYIAV